MAKSITYTNKDYYTINVGGEQIFKGQSKTFVDTVPTEYSALVDYFKVTEAEDEPAKPDPKGPVVPKS